MDNKEAIKILTIDGAYLYPDRCYNYKAFELAIKALETVEFIDAGFGDYGVVINKPETPIISYDELDVGSSYKEQLLYFYNSSHFSMTLKFENKSQAKRSWESFRRAKNRANLPISISLIENRVYFIKEVDNEDNGRNQ